MEVLSNGTDCLFSYVKTYGDVNKVKVLTLIGCVNFILLVNLKLASAGFKLKVLKEIH